MPRPAAPALSIRWYDGRLVGKVVTPGHTEFGYAPEWLASGHDLSPLSVPFTPVLFRQRADGFDHLPGFLTDCLPDQWGRRLMQREFLARDLMATPMRMLAWVGRRSVGALTFEPALEEEHSHSAWEEVTPLLLTREAQAVLWEAPQDAFRHLRQGGTAGGALPKANVALLRDGTVLSGGDLFNNHELSGAKLGLLKLDFEDDPTRSTTDGRAELAYLKMARACGIHVAQAKVLADNDRTRPRYHLFVERFDVVRSEKRRRHLLSLAGALHSHHLTYTQLLLVTRDLTQDHAQVLEAVRRMCFNVRAGNADDHGKNHSFLFDDSNGRWGLSPAYDLTPSYSAEGNFRGLFPNTFGAQPRRQAMRDVAAEAGVSAEEFDRIDAAVATQVARWSEYAERVDLPKTLMVEVKLMQQGLATSLEMEPTLRGRRRKRW